MTHKIVVFFSQLLIRNISIPDISEKQYLPSGKLTSLAGKSPFLILITSSSRVPFPFIQLSQFTRVDGRFYTWRLFHDSFKPRNRNPGALARSPASAWDTLEKHTVPRKVLQKIFVPTIFCLVPTGNTQKRTQTNVPEWPKKTLQSALIQWSISHGFVALVSFNPLKNVSHQT